jgi:chromosome segregation ATPase
MQTKVTNTLAILVVLILFLPLTGCNEDKLESLYEETVELRGELEEQYDELEQTKEELEEAREELDELRSKLSDIESHAYNLQSNVMNLLSEIDDFDYEDWRTNVPVVESAADDVESTMQSILWWF